VSAEQRSTAGCFAGEVPVPVLGSDAAGTIEALGPGVTGLRVGEPVFYFSDFLGSDGGSYAEYQAVDAGIIAPRPTSLSHAEAAAVPLAAGTAYEVVVRRLAVTTGEWLVICGASGGVGTYAIQLAKHLGARVIDAGNLRTVITREYPLEQVAAAHRELERRHAGGKLVLTIR
jgi:NADPH2:quinone reductase